MKALKKLALTSTIFLAATSSNANLDGDTCWTSYNKLSATYICHQTFKDERLTIKEIYQRGYKVVSQVYAKGYTKIIIEQQK